MQVIIIILLILAILLVIFTLQNSIGISITVFFWEITDAPLVLVLLVCIVSGYLLSTIYLLPKIWKLKKEKSQLLKKTESIQKNDTFQTIPESSDDDYEGMELDDDDNNSFFKD
ncbi:MAG: DUF1049 domain-containing protein [Mariniphaga sp.]|nr:DUF1049 domain-containing protein [Mariniphaga sp.]